MPNILNQIQDAIVDLIDGTDFSLEINQCYRAYAPTIELAELAGLVVVVVPNAVEFGELDRLRTMREYLIDVVVQRKIAHELPSSNPDIPYLLTQADNTVTFMEELATALQRTSFDPPGAAWVKTEWEPVFDREQLTECSKFTSVLTLTYKVRV